MSIFIEPARAADYDAALFCVLGALVIAICWALAEMLE
jgi:hypothetical protein